MKCFLSVLLKKTLVIWFTLRCARARCIVVVVVSSFPKRIPKFQFQNAKPRMCYSFQFSPFLYCIPVIVAKVHSAKRMYCRIKTEQIIDTFFTMVSHYLSPYQMPWYKLVHGHVNLFFHPNTK